MKEQLLNRFLNYVKHDTQSSEESTTFPSTSKQLDFAKLLADECQTMGLSDVSVDEYGYVMATLPSNIEADIPTIGFIAHMDTAPDNSGANVNPHIVTFTGEDIALNAEGTMSIRIADNPILKGLEGETLIVTDGTTLLGADDKAGIAEIMTAMAYFLAHPEVPHGTIRICFTPDEEVGQGADHFDVARFNAAFAYTVDGGTLGELESENFNAAGAKVIVSGHNIHPGYAKDRMINSITLAQKFDHLLPQDEVPEKTSGYEGFFHLHGITGSVEETVLSYIIRDFDAASFAKRQTLMLEIADKLNVEYGANTFNVTIKEQYRNMKEIIDQDPSIITLAETAMKNVGITPVRVPIRGGTDGARLSFMGLPCPNLFTGGYNFHSKNEFAVLAHMEAALQTIIEIVKIHTSYSK